MSYENRGILTSHCNIFGERGALNSDRPALKIDNR